MISGTGGRHCSSLFPRLLLSTSPGASGAPTRGVLPWTSRSLLHIHTSEMNINSSTPSSSHRRSNKAPSAVHLTLVAGGDPGPGLPWGEHPREARWLACQEEREPEPEGGGESLRGIQDSGGGRRALQLEESRQERAGREPRASQGAWPSAALGSLQAMRNIFLSSLGQIPSQAVMLSACRVMAQ